MKEEFYHPLSRVSDNSLLVSTRTQKVIRLYCPIEAVCIRAFRSYSYGDSVTITAVKEDENKQLLYRIGALTYPHHYFEIKTQSPTS